MKYIVSLLLAVLWYVMSTIVLVSLTNKTVPENTGKTANEIHQIDSLRRSYLHSLSEDERAKVSEQIELTNRQLFFNKHPQFMLWIGVVSMGISLSIAFIPWFYAEYRQRFNFLSKKVKSLYALLAFLSIVAVFFVAHFPANDLMLQPTQIMADAHIMFADLGEEVMGTLIFLQFIAPLAALFINFLVLHHTAVKLKSDELLPVARLSELQSFAQNLLLVSSLMLVFGIISTSLFRKSILGFFDAAPQVFPKEFVIIYGCIFTFFLFVFYTPTQLALNKLAQKHSHLSMSDADASKGVVNNKLIASVLSFLAPLLSSILLEHVLR